MTPDTDLFGRPVVTPAARTWVPTAYMGEAMPKPRATPSAWLITLADGRRALDLSEMDPKLHPTALRDADCIEFRWLEQYPAVELQISADRTWTVSAQPHPQTDTVCLWEDNEAVADSLEELAEQLLRTRSHDSPAITLATLCYCWSDSLPFFFSAKTGNFETGLAEAPAAGAA